MLQIIICACNVMENLALQATLKRAIWRRRQRHEKLVFAKLFICIKATLAKTRQWTRWRKRLL